MHSDYPDIDLVELGTQINAVEFDHPFVLHPDGTITDPEPEPAGWALLTLDQEDQ